MDQVLYITPFDIYPPTTGGTRFILNYIEEISMKIKVVVITPKTQRNFKKNNIEQIRLFDNGIKKYLNPFSFLSIYRIILNYKPQKVIVAMPYHAFFLVPFCRLMRIDCYIHEQNVEFLRFKTLQKWWWPVMYLYEYFVYKLANKILYISDLDRVHLIHAFHINANKFIPSPYRADTLIFKPNTASRQRIRKKMALGNRPIILFFGPLDYKPNRDALSIIQNKIAPKLINDLPEAVFIIAGKNPPTHKLNNNIILTGYVDKIEDYINASDIVIVPLLSGGGIRTKILESLACDKPVISTTVGAEGINKEKYHKMLFIEDNLLNYHIRIMEILNDK